MFSKFTRKFFSLFNFRKPKNKNRPHFYSKNAWSYVRNGKPTPAMRLLLNLGVTGA